MGHHFHNGDRADGNTGKVMWVGHPWTGRSEIFECGGVVGVAGIGISDGDGGTTNGIASSSSSSGAGIGGRVGWHGGRSLRGGGALL